MNYVALAHSLDGRDMPREAAWAYEIAIHESEASLDDYLDLTALYFTICDTGYTAAHQLDQSFAEVAYDRAVDVLRLAEVRFGPSPDIEFWRLYLRDRVLGEIVPPEAYLKLAFMGGSPMPYLALYVASGKTSFHQEVEPLVSATRFGRTSRERYVRSLVL